MYAAIVFAAISASPFYITPPGDVAVFTMQGIVEDMESPAAALVGRKRLILTNSITSSGVHIGCPLWFYDNEMHAKAERLIGSFAEVDYIVVHNGVMNSRIVVAVRDINEAVIEVPQYPLADWWKKK